MPLCELEAGFCRGASDRFPTVTHDGPSGTVTSARDDNGNAPARSGQLTGLTSSRILELGGELGSAQSQHPGERLSSVQAAAMRLKQFRCLWGVVNKTDGVVARSPHQTLRTALPAIKALGYEGVEFPVRARRREFNCSDAVCVVGVVSARVGTAVSVARICP